MRKITDSVYTTDEPGAGMPGVLVGRTSLIIVDPGYDTSKQHRATNSLDGSPLNQLKEFSEEIGKPVRYIILTHAHGDHTADLRFYQRSWEGIQIYAHAKNRAVNPKSPFYLKIKIDRAFDKDTDLEIDGVLVRVMATPGHTENGEDISLWVPEGGLIFTGDLVQPHGFPYREGNWETFMPFYTRGDEYSASLQKVIDLDPKLVHTCHDFVYRGTEPIKTNREIVERTRQLAEKLSAEHPEVPERTLVNWVFDTIGSERGVPRHRVLHRRGEPTEEAVEELARDWNLSPEQAREKIF